MKVRLVIIENDKRIVEDRGFREYELDKNNARVEVLKYHNGSVDFEPAEPLDFYTWNDNREIILDMAKKQKALNAQQIAALKTQLAAMDYKTSKYADGEYTQGEWAAVVTERKVIRIQIRALENQV